METILNKFYLNFPVHFYSYQKDEKKIDMVFYNEEQQLIKSITLDFGEERLTQQVDSGEKIIKLSLDLDKIKDRHQKPVLYSCLVGDKEYLLEDCKDTYTIKAPESIFNLGQERFFYSQELAKLTNRPKREIQYIADEAPHYWHCTCGTYNLNSFEKCTNCGNEKQVLFSKTIPIDEENDKKTHRINIFKSAFFWIFITFALELAYQSFNGDYMFDNETRNEFFQVLNRLIIPSLMLVVVIGILLALIYYKRVLGLALRITFYGLVIYLNVISAIMFIATAYNLLFLVALDVLVLYIFYQKIKEKRTDLNFIILTVFTIASLIFIGVQWRTYSGYDLQIIDGGIRLNVQDAPKEYVVPTTIDGLKVKKVYFSVANDYSIEKLTISKYVDNILIYSSAVLPDLKEVAVDPGNTAYYVNGNILYNADDTMKLVPLSVQSLTIENTDTINNSQFRDLYNLKTLVIGKDVKYIGAEAFINNTSLQSLTFEDGSQIESIDVDAFKNCESLESIDLPISLQTMGMGAFEGCSNLVSIRMPFLGEEREKIDDLSKNTDLLVYMFGTRSYLDTSVIPNSLQSIEIYDVDRIHNVTFYGAKYLRSITLPDTMVHLGKQSFYGTTSLESFTVPDGVTTIDSNAFEKSGITEITIPASVTEIVFNAFLDCDNLTTVHYLGDINDLNIAPTGNDTFIAALNGGN